MHLGQKIIHLRRFIKRIDEYALRRPELVTWRLLDTRPRDSRNEP